jgi:hypothetical protein
MQKWDYLIVLQWRNYKDRETDALTLELSKWQIKVFEKGQEKEWKDGIFNLLVKLGDEGWELASVVAASDILGGAHEIVGTIKPELFTNGSTGTIYGITTDFAGFTSKKEWVFKRPRQ